MTTEPKIEDISTPDEPVEEKTAPRSLQLADFLEKLGKCDKAEEKIRQCLDFMRSSLSESRAPRFKDFWEGKKICLPFFKESLSPSARSHLWAEYIELSTEARKLKEILDEESAFAMEQIDLAITALEKDLEQYDALLQQTQPVSFAGCRAIEKKRAEYQEMQRELNLLNVFAAKVNGMRKEVIKTEMRIRFKNRLFDRLSAAGDKVFPKRKELIRKISTEFASDVAGFVSRNFQGALDPNGPVFELREEIKALQSLAKQLTLDTRSFTETRLELSKCWDTLKQVEKDRKKEVVQKKQEYKKNYDLVMDKIKVLAEKCQGESCTMDDASKLSGEILSFMRGIELGREEVKLLKDAIQQAKSPVFDKLKKEQDARERQLEEVQRQKREKLDGLKQEIETAIASTDSIPIEESSKSRIALAKQVDALSLTSAEQEVFHDLLKALRDKIIEKKEQAMMNLSEDAKSSLEQLNNILDERKMQRQEIRAQIEQYRKALSGSGFDFEKAMRYRELIDAEKLRLEKTDAAIEEIEQKIADFEG
jgi:hypothetical protein